MAAGLRAPGEDACLPRPDGDPWRNDDYRNWRGRVFVPAAKAAGSSEPRPYDLRHSFVSLLIQEGVSIVEVARQAGHSPEECLRTYAHTFEEFDPADRTPRRPRSSPPGRARGDLMYAFCTRGARQRRSLGFGSMSEADGGIRTLDPRFTRAVWGVWRGQGKGPVGRTVERSTVDSGQSWGPPMHHLTEVCTGPVRDGFRDQGSGGLGFGLQSGVRERGRRVCCKTCCIGARKGANHGAAAMRGELYPGAGTGPAARLPRDRARQGDPALDRAGCEW